MASESQGAATLDNDIQEQAVQHTVAANPLVGVRGDDIVGSARMLVGQIINNPAMAAQQFCPFSASSVES